MSIQSIQNNIERIQREVSSIQQQLTNETKNEASKTERMYQAEKSKNQSSNISIIQSKQREIDQYQRDIISIQKKKSVLTKRIADKTSELHKYQQQLFREQDQEQKKLMKSLRDRNEELKQQQNNLFRQIDFIPISHGVATYSSNSLEVSYDAFISYASEDRLDLVRPLADKLTEEGFSIWYDEFKLEVGESLRHSIDKGLKNSRFGIVVLSPNFFKKNWPQYELDGLVTREMNGGKIILPLWHKVSKDEVINYSPTLADKIALSTATYTLDEIALALSNKLNCK